MTRFGLEVNETKTRVARLPEDDFTFLGYTIGRFYGKDGRSFVGTRPSKKAVKSLLRRIHDRTTPQWYPDNPSNTVVVSRFLRGWWAGQMLMKHGTAQADRMRRVADYFGVGLPIVPASVANPKTLWF